MNHCESFGTKVVPPPNGINLRLSDEDAEALRQQAEREHRSRREVARLAIADRIARDQRRSWVDRNIGDIMDRDAELLARLAK